MYNLRPDETLAGCIDIFRDAWIAPQRAVSDLESLQKSTWFRAKLITKNVDAPIRTNDAINLNKFKSQSNNLSAINLINKFSNVLNSATKDYVQKHDIDGCYHEDYRALRYHVGEEFKTHYDGSTETHRAISAIVYLNDDYEGGEIEFTNFGVKIKPEAGMLLLFPSNYAYTHVAHPVTSGTKYALVTWMHDQPIYTKQD